MDKWTKQKKRDACQSLPGIDVIKEYKASRHTVYLLVNYIGNWRIYKLLLPHNHYYGAKNLLTKAFVLLAPFLYQTNIINGLFLNYVTK